jgi:hypothetical protein
MMLSRTQSGQWVQSASGPLPEAVTCVTDGESLLAVVADTWPARELRLVQPETGRVVQRFTRTEGRWSGAFALSPDGRFFAAEVESSLEAGKGALEVWDVARQRLIKSLEPQQCASLSFSQDSHWLLSLAMEGGTIYDTARSARASLCGRFRPQTMSFTTSPTRSSKSPLCLTVA